MRLSIMAGTIIAGIMLCAPVFAWNDATHMAVMKAAGLDDYAYLAVGPDMAKEKSGGHEEGNHYCNNGKGTVVTADTVLDQVGDYNCRCGGKGHLYGAIIAACHQYLAKMQKNKYDRYELGFAAHYMADLSMPLHNVDYNEFNMTNHMANDGAVEPRQYEPTDAKVAKIAAGIKQRMKAVAPYRLPSAKADPKSFDLALARKIAELANRAMVLGYAMQDAKPPRPVMSVEEAYRQLAESAVLLKAAYSAMHP